MRAKTPLLLAVLACPLIVAGCGNPFTDPQPETAGEPPPIVLHLAEGDELFESWTTCWDEAPPGGRAYCADGGPPRHPRQVGAPTRIEFGFDRDDWDFEATFRKSSWDDGCAPTFPAVVRRTGDRTFEVLAAVAPPGRWHVDLRGNGPEGDVVTTFAWRIPMNSDHADPTAVGDAVC